MNEWHRLRENVRTDLTAMARLKGHERLTAGAAVDVLLLPGTCSVLLFRLASACHRAHLRPVSRLLYFLNMVLFSVDFAPAATVGPGLVVPHPVGSAFTGGVVLGRNVTLTGMVRIGGGASEQGAPDGDPVVEDDVWLLDGAKAFGPIRIGARTVVGTNAVVIKDLPPDVVAVGAPARAVKKRADRPGGAAPLSA